MFPASIGTPLTMDEFAWTRTQAVFYNNLCYAGLAVIAVISFMAAKILTKWWAVSCSQCVPTLSHQCCACAVCGAG